MGLLLSAFFLIAFPLGIAFYLASRIKSELEEGRSYMWGWADRASTPGSYWFNLGMKAIGALAFVYLPASIGWDSLKAFAE